MFSLLENRYRTDSILHFFDLSIILPFYKKIKEFRRTLLINAPFFQRNGIEVIIVLDEPSEEHQVKQIAIDYPFINWKILINRQTHEWRNPSKVINVGIRFASMKYIMVMSPESEFFTDAIYLLREALEYYPDHFAYGRVIFAAFDEVISDSKNQIRPFGSIMLEKRHLEKVEGYNETLAEWGGDDDDVRARLEISGIRRLYIPDALLIHREDATEKRKREKKHIPSLEQRFKLLNPTRQKSNGELWGTDFNEVCYDWKIDRFKLHTCQKYLDSFENYPPLLSENILKKPRRIIVLAPARNEEENISDFIEHMGKICDGIIFLDDESTDKTYELMQGENVLLKVKKKHLGFDDITNRNILLNIASFFNTEWLLFMDIDEEFDKRYGKLDDIVNCKEYDVCTFNFIHLWDNYDTYNSAYPGSKKGVVEICRMFRSKGRLQINTNKTLHFAAVPYYKPLNPSNKSILVLHKGHLAREKRIKKYKYYLQEDKKGDQDSYEYLIDSSSVLAKVSELEL